MPAGHHDLGRPGHIGPRGRGRRGVDGERASASAIAGSTILAIGEPHRGRKPRWQTAGPSEGRLAAALPLARAVLAVVRCVEGQREEARWVLMSVAIGLQTCRPKGSG